MLVVHGVWRAAGGLALWAEDSTLPAVGKSRRIHPYAVAPDVYGKPGEATFLLPSAGGRPLESPELFREDAPGHRAPKLAPWQVPTVELDADEALEFLLTPPDGAGGTIRHLAEVARYAVDLVARGRVVPTVGGTDDVPLALWRPVLTGEDRPWVQTLLHAMPPVGRTSEAGELRPAEEVFAQTLDALVDAAARTALPPEDADTWPGALAGTRRAFTATPEQLAKLRHDLDQWARDAAAGSVRAFFRLVEPLDPESDDPWRVELSLQAADEPSLVVPAGDIWESQRGHTALARYLDAPQETFLAELGRAARLWPYLDRALAAARPADLPLDTAEAHAFLRDAAPLLAGAGFGVLLPSWWGKPAARIGAKLTAKSPTAPATVANGTTLGLDAMIDYEWQLALGDHTLTEAELKRLAKVKAPLVRVRGQWVELDAKRLAAGLALMATKGQMSVLDLLTGAPAAAAGLPVVDVQASGWVRGLLDGEKITAVEPSGQFTGVLRPYQQRGLSWLAFLERLGLGAVLADSMGLGKTVQLLALLSRENVGPTLLVCPMSLVGNWEREAAKFAPALRVHVHHGAERAQGESFPEAVRGADLVVTTYALAARDAEALSRIQWHRVVVDEAQAIKNAATRQAVAIRSLPARHKIAVTGTPVENRLADLWAIMEFANPGLLGPASEFKRAYAEPIQRQGDQAAAERLRRLTQPFVLRRLKTDKSIISDLPEKLEMEVVCNLTAEQATLYQAIVDDALAAIEGAEGIERKGLVLATMTKLKQVCNHPAQLLRDGSRLAGRSGKLARLEEILEEVLEAGEKALLFSQYAEFGGALQAYLTGRFGREVLFLHGGVAKSGRDEMVQRFQGGHALDQRRSQADDGPPIFVLSLKAGGTGLTLTAANHVIHVDRWWNPAVEDQATDRAFRIGQKRNVQVRKFVCAGTVEERISAMLAEKRDLAERIVGTGEGWITELSTDDLRDLFTLDRSAVVE
ncbi:DEAD/DEAH box helicase [Hamadaea sp. NPDC051192]|uniref:DEAD/DEAH box helicase n=1 Tax=Hamadaea sp. NPDC051192 TaxID=3154940 RepID=UPI00341395A1